MTLRKLIPTSLACTLVALGCCDDPWSAYPESTPPDISCDSGGSVWGYDVYIWECIDDRRKVVAKYSDEWSCDEPVREFAKCGELTDLEKRLKLTDEMCTGARPGANWR